MRSRRAERRRLAAAGLAGLLLAGAAAGEEPRRDIADVDLGGLLDLSVGAASLREEHVSEAAATVFVLDGEDLRRQGFRTLEEALRSVPGLFGYHDGMYGYIGVRGVGLLSDYTTRLLVLVDGHPLNDALGIGASHLGRDAPIVLDAVRRVEVVKGPVGSVYGPTAFLGVVNVVTVEPAASGSEIHAGTELTQGRGSGAGMSTVTSSVQDDVVWTAALEGTAARGQTWVFPELGGPADTRPPPPGGAVSGVDESQSLTGTLRVNWGRVRVAAACNRAEAQLPSAPYESIIGDERNRRVNQRCYLDAAVAHTLRPGLTLTSRASFDWFDYRDTFAYAPPPESTGVTYDLGIDRWLTGELRLEWEPDQANHATAGVTVQGHDTIQRSWAADLPSKLDDPVNGIGVGDIEKSWVSVNAYLLAERRVVPTLRLHVGATLYADSLYGSRFTPKIGLVWTPRPQRTVKLVYSEGFRPPVASEAFFDDSTTYTPNPDLRPETVRSVELSGEALLGGIVTLSASAYSSWYDDLIRLRTVPAPGAPGETRLQEQNVGTMDVQGAELGVNLRWREWLWAYGGLAAQRTATADRVNFPGVTANLALSTRPLQPLTLALNGTFIAMRDKDVDRPETATATVPSAFLLNANARLEVSRVHGLGLELGVQNLLDVRASSPGPADFYPITEHPEPARTFRLSVRWSTR